VSKPKPDLKSLLEELRESTEESVARERKMSAVSDSLHYFYCPECLAVMVFFADDLYEEKKPKCPSCRVELRPVDDNFKAEYERVAWAFYEKAKSVMERIWPVLESWPRGVRGYIADAGLVEVYFGVPLLNVVGLVREGRGVKAIVCIHYLSEEEFEKLMSIISTLREEGVRGEVKVRVDRCAVPDEKMRAQGFVQMRELRRLPLDNWHLKL
jgi:hypothetical protein